MRAGANRSCDQTWQIRLFRICETDTEVARSWGCCVNTDAGALIALLLRGSIAEIWFAMFGEEGGSPFSTQRALAETNARWPVPSFPTVSIRTAAMVQARAVAVR